MSRAAIGELQFLRKLQRLLAADGSLRGARRRTGLNLGEFEAALLARRPAAAGISGVTARNSS